MRRSNLRGVGWAGAPDIGAPRAGVTPRAPGGHQADARLIARAADLAEVPAEIVAAEGAMNERLCQLYDLTEEERLLVENGGRSRAGGRISHDRASVEP